MKKAKPIIIILCLIILGFGSFHLISDSTINRKTASDKKSSHLKGIDPDKVDWKSKTDEYWKKNLGDLQYQVTRHEGTERAFTGKYWQSKEKRIYTCSNCGQELFHSDTKFKSGTGWPSYYQPIRSSAVGVKIDRSYGVIRTEVHCSRCGAHLGHIFDDGPQPTGKRYCINSVSLNHKDLQ